MPPTSRNSAPPARLEPHLLAQRRDRLGLRIEPQHELRRIAGHDFDQREDDEAPDQKARDSEDASGSGRWGAAGRGDLRRVT